MSEAAADPWLPRFLRVRSVRSEVPDVTTIELAPPPGGFAFRPGQFNMLYAFGVGEVAISISGDSAEPERLVHTSRAVGKVTGALGRLEPGMQVGVRGPYGTPWPLEACEGRDVLIVAGGLGLAPLRGTILHLLRNRRRFGRLALLVGGRSPDQLLFRDELAAWEQGGEMQVEVTVDHAGPEWQGHVGVVPDLLGRAGVEPANSVAMVCGPEVMIRFSVEGLRALGVPDGRIHVSLERNMKCALGHCGRCQLGPNYVCKDGPVFPWPRVGPLMLRGDV